MNCVLYRGVDYLDVGLFIDVANRDKYDKKISKLREYLLYDDNKRYVKFGSFKLKVNTKRNIKPYRLFLSDSSNSISIYLTNSPHESKVYSVKYDNQIFTPDIFVRVSGRALRTQNIQRTQNIIKQVLQYLNATVYAYIYSRVDYCIDIYDTSSLSDSLAVSIVDDTKLLRLKTTMYEKTASNTNLTNAIIHETSISKNDKLIYYSRGSKGYEEIVAYTTTNRDAELLQIYLEHLKAYNIQTFKLEDIKRVEYRVWRDFLKNNNHELSKLYLVEDFNLFHIIKNATVIVDTEILSDTFRQLADSITPLFSERFQFSRDNLLDDFKETSVPRKVFLSDTSLLSLIQQLDGLIRSIKERIETYLNKKVSFHFVEDFIKSFRLTTQYTQYLLKKIDDNHEKSDVIKEFLTYIYSFSSSSTLSDDIVADLVYDTL